jgi:hypothetical protein
MRKNFVRTLLGLCLLIALAASSAMPAAGAVLYVQNPNYNGAYASQNDPSGFGNFATAYDNFTLSSTATISWVEWAGSYFNPQVAGAITGFTISFYADAAGTPGALLASTGDVAGNAGETFVGLDNAGSPTYFYGMGATLAATAGTQYWMSIVPDSVLPPQWGWETGSGGDGAAYQCFFGACGATPDDLAFALATPEPGSIALLATGLVAVGIRVRNRYF